MPPCLPRVQAVCRSPRLAFYLCNADLPLPHACAGLWRSSWCTCGARGWRPWLATAAPRMDASYGSCETLMVSGRDAHMVEMWYFCISAVGCVCAFPRFVFYLSSCTWAWVVCVGSDGGAVRKLALLDDPLPADQEDEHRGRALPRHQHGGHPARPGHLTTALLPQARVRGAHFTIIFLNALKHDGMFRT